MDFIKRVSTIKKPAAIIIALKEPEAIKKSKVKKKKPAAIAKHL